MIVVKDMERLRKVTFLKGFSYSQLAKNIGVSKTTIGSIYTGKRNPSPKIAVNICEQIEEPFDNIFFIESVHKKER